MAINTNPIHGQRWGTRRPVMENMVSTKNDDAMFLLRLIDIPYELAMDLMHYIRDTNIADSERMFPSGVISRYDGDHNVGIVEFKVPFPDDIVPVKEYADMRRLITKLCSSLEARLNEKLAGAKDNEFLRSFVYDGAFPLAAYECIGRRLVTIDSAKKQYMNISKIEKCASCWCSESECKLGDGSLTNCSFSRMLDYLEFDASNRLRFSSFHENFGDVGSLLANFTKRGNLIVLLDLEQLLDANGLFG